MKWYVIDQIKKVILYVGNHRDAFDFYWLNNRGKLLGVYADTPSNRMLINNCEVV